ncbi:hypothetical protein OG746_26735 [Streptomyces sp. NBC_01016]|uniref:hypothetical protein n=1 Tax=Streptomyces sp. NBC_01016 TaxID=2903720 RepID=UPI0022536B6B|nr:hypothetical protein [Streptomyces sp. NBC_01016]MCX4827173.1 hypothetical protein [Streptomyces sp. NBC_01016]MCX4832338.1 hypothetical protein [Streptomyces sp. NBC_01016]
MNRRTTAAGLLVTAALALTACSSVDNGDAKPKASATDKPKASATEKANPNKLDDAGKFACDDFAKDYQSADTTQARLDLAHKVNKWAPKSYTKNIADNGKVLARGAGGSDGSWQIAADTFAQSCLDAGWKA